MCEYCEPYEFNGGKVISPLPTRGFNGDDTQMCMSQDVDGSICIISVTYPPIVSGPVNYCPMCGRKLVK